MKRKPGTWVCETVRVLAGLAVVWMLGSSAGMGQALQPAERFVFEATSVRQLTPKEIYDVTPDCPECLDVTVRLRLTAGEQPIYYYTSPFDKVPEVFTIRKENGKVFWLQGQPGNEWRDSSPGMKGLPIGLGGVWRKLSPHSAIEWQEGTHTNYAGQTQAFSIFIRDGKLSQALEVASTPFPVPRNTNPPAIAKNEFDAGLTCLVTLELVKKALGEVRIRIGGGDDLIAERSDIPRDANISNRRVHVLFLAKRRDRAWLGAFQIGDRNEITAEPAGYALGHSKDRWVVTGGTKPGSTDDQVAAYVENLIKNERVREYKPHAFAGSCSPE